MSVGAAFMRLEAEIAEAWRAEFAQEAGRGRSELARRRTSEGRFLSGASACVLGWLRAQGHYDMAVEEFCAQVADTALVRLRHQSHVHSFELLVNNALGALLDSGNPAHIERGVQCLDALEAVIAAVETPASNRSVLAKGCLALGNVSFTAGGEARMLAAVRTRQAAVSFPHAFD